MGYARHIGRVGALAVTLGVGVAVATTPGIAYAQTDTDKVTTEDSTTTTPPETGATPPAETPGDSDPDSKSGTPEADEGETTGDENLVDELEDAAEGDADTLLGGNDEKDGTAALAATVKGSGSDDKKSAVNDDDTTLRLAAAEDDADTGFAANVLRAPLKRIAAAADDAASSAFLPPALENVVTRFADRAAAAAVSRPAPAAPAARARLDTVVTNFVSLLQVGGSGTGSPLDAPLLAFVWAFARRDFGSLAANFAAQQGIAAPQQENVLYVDQADLADTLALLALDNKRHVLLIGVDGTNIINIEDDDYNRNFFALQDMGTTAVTYIGGHTSISNPQWTSMLTGVYSERAGVTNNVFTPSTYSEYQTLYQQLETLYGDDIDTTSIANWVVQSQLAGGGGSISGADVVKFVQFENSWENTDDIVGELSMDAIDDTEYGKASFQFTYFVGVDNTGHETYGGSPEYIQALRNVNDNIGKYADPTLADPNLRGTGIMGQVWAWENSGDNLNDEYFTIIAVTDHGQSDRLAGVPQGGQLAHGFQTPIEITPWIMALDPAAPAAEKKFKAGAQNNTWETVDITPTILDLFGADQQTYFEGEPVMNKDAATYTPATPGTDALRASITNAYNMYGYPSIATNLRLSSRTIVATIPYTFYALFNGWINGGVPSFLVTPVTILGSIVYNGVNIPAQAFIKLTGVPGNSIIPASWNPFTPQPVPVNA